MSTTLAFFWNLASSSKSERLDASVQLISALERFQNDFSPEEQDSQPESPIDALNAPDVAYSLRRLIRGLSSPRECSRLGFSVALTELLSRLHSIQCADIFNLLMQNSTPPSSMSRQEERDLLFAQLFGCTAIIQSGLLLRASTPNQSSSTFTPSDLDTFSKLVDVLIALGERKSWLRESAWWSLQLAIDALHKSAVPWRDHAFTWLCDRIFKQLQLWPLEKLAIALRLQDLLPSQDWSTLLSPPFNNSQLLHSSNFSVIARLLRESQKGDEEDAHLDTVPASWQPRLHFVWDILLDKLLSSSKGSDSGVTFQDFFRITVDESLFSTNSSAQRKYHGFLVLQKSLGLVEPAHAPRLLTQNFMRTWINHLSRKDRALHKISMQIVKRIQDFVKSNPETGLPLLAQISGEHGNVQFDKVTNTNTVQTILASMNAEGVRHYIDSLFSQLKNTTNLANDEANLESHRSWIFEQLSSLVRNTCIPKQDDSVETILQFFIANGLFNRTKSSKHKNDSIVWLQPSTPQSQATCRQYLLKCVSSLMTQTVSSSEDRQDPPKNNNGSTVHRIPGVASDGQFWINKTIQIVLRWSSKPKYSFYKKQDQTITQALASAKNAKTNDTPLATGVSLLLDGLTLHYLCLESSDSLENITTCLEVLNIPTKSSPKDLEPISGAESVDLIVDMVVGFMEAVTAFTRSLGKLVFSNITNVLEESSVDLLLAQLQQKTPDQLRDLEDSDSDEDMDSEDESEGDTSTPATESDSDNMGDDEDVEGLKNKLEAVFSQNEAAGSDSDVEMSDELLDDDQMLAVDDQLSAVFKSRVSSTKDKDLQREATHFKNRILDLIDIFLKNESSNPLILTVILPILDLVLHSSSDEQQLVEKARGILKTRFCKAKAGAISGEVTKVDPILEKVHASARKCQNPDILKMLGEISIFICRITPPVSIVAVYKSSLEDFASRKNCPLNSSFFQRFVQLFPKEAWGLRQDILTSSSHAVNGFRASQLLQFLLSIVNQIEPKDLPDFAETFGGIETTIIKLLQVANTDDLVLTPPQTKELLKSCLSALRRCTQPGIQTGWVVETWKGLGKQIEENPRYQNSRALSDLCCRIAACLDPEQQPPAKRKREESKSVGKPGQKRKKT